MLLQEPVQAAIWDALNHYALQDATFLAERLYAEVKNEDAIFLLATCYYRAGKAMKAYSLLQTRGCTAPQNKYLLARCCVQVNKYSEAENVLAGSALTKCKSNDDIINEFGNSACYILSLLGLIYSKTERTAKASECYRCSLKLNPLLWSSFERLCQLGEKVDVARIFQLPEQNLTHSSGQWLVTNLSNYLHSQNAAQPLSQSTGSSGSSPVITDCRPQTPVSQLNEIILQPGTPDTPLPSMGTLETPASPDPLSVNMAPLKARGRKVERVLLDVPATFSPLTPSFGILPLPMDTPSPGEGSFTTTVPFITPSPTVLPDSQPLAPRASRKMQPVTRRNQNQNQSPMADLRDLPSIFRSHPGGGLLPGMTGNATNVRRSTRLFTNSVKENNKTQPPKTKYSSPKAPGRKTKTRLSKSQQELNEINKGELGVEAKNAANADVATEIQLAQLQRQSLVGILSLLQTVGRAYQTQCLYECERAIELYSELPPQQYNTAWVLCQVGRAYSLLAQYQKAEKVFAAVRQLEPYHVEGMEMYSTTLWHLQRDIQLSALAQELTEMDKNAPEGWCAAGNCFSLQKEHDAAIKFFQRAIQVAPDFAYAYTLLGHEYAFTEELDKALSCFRNAVRVDPRHYNARYGVGMIYYKQEKFNLAEVHFRKALSIFPDNSILLCHIGVVQHSLQKTDSALNTLNKAIAVDPKNPLCKFHRASVLFANDRHQEALAELEELKEIVPTESLVYFLIGKVHKKLGNTHLALMNFSWAMDLDPKGANNQIKEAIDKRYVTEEEEGDSSARLDTTGLDESDAIPGEAGNASNSWDDVFLRDRDEDAQAQMLESYESL